MKIFYTCSSSKSNRNNRNRIIKCQWSNRKKMDVNDSPNWPYRGYQSTIKSYVSSISVWPCTAALKTVSPTQKWKKMVIFVRFSQSFTHNNQYNKWNPKVHGFKTCRFDAPSQKYMVTGLFYRWGGGVGVKKTWFEMKSIFVLKQFNFFFTLLYVAPVPKPPFIYLPFWRLHVTVHVVFIWWWWTLNLFLLLSGDGRPVTRTTL